MRRAALSVLPVAALCFFSAACTARAVNRMPSEQSVSHKTILAESLFAEDAEIISQQDVDAILTSRIAYPSEGRLLVHSLSADHPVVGWGPAAGEGEMLQGRLFLAALEDIPSVANIQPLPDLLAPAEPSISNLRRIAIRFQADWILVFTARSRSVRDCLLFRKDQYTGYALIEAALIDSRTGLIPFAHSANATAETTHQAEDVTSSGTRDRIRREAVDGALGKVANTLREFLARQGSE